jgi:DNA-binding NarL/FixJ family response regulator
MKKIKLLIVDDHMLVRSGVITLLSDQDDMIIAGEASSGEEAVEKAKSCSPDVVLMDISMSGISGLEAAEIILKDSPQIKIVILTMHEEKEYIYNALKLKVSGILNKNADKYEITEAIRTAFAGNRFYSKNILDVLTENFIEGTNRSEEKISTMLSRREKEILVLIAEGFSSSEIAAQLLISPRTVDTHRSNMIQKYNLKSAQGLIKFAIDFVNTQKNNSTQGT